MKKNSKEFLVLILLTLLIVLSYWQIIFLDKTLLTHGGTKVIEGSGFYTGFDTTEITVIDPAGSAWIDEPLAQATKYKLNNNKLPLWNEFSGTGKPLFANQTSNAFSILRYIFPLNLFPTPIMWDLYLIFRIVLLALLFYWYLRVIQLDVVSSFVASFLLASSGHILMYNNLFQLDVEIIVPLLFIGIEMFFRKNNLFLFIIPLSVLLLITGGNVQSSLSIFIAGFFYIIVRLLQIYGFNLKFFINCLFLGLLLVIGIFISGFYLIPFLEFYLNSFHAHGLGTGMQFFSLKTIPSFLSPFMSGPIHSGWNGFSQHFIPSYLGVLPIIVVLYFLFSGELFKKHKNKSFAFALLFIFIFFILKVFNIPPIAYIGKLPILNRLIFTKYLFPLYFSFFSLFGIAFNRLFKKNFLIKKPFIFVLIFFILGLVYLYGIRTVIKLEPNVALKYDKSRYILYHTFFSFMLLHLFLFIVGYFSRLTKVFKTTLIVLIFIVDPIINISIINSKKFNRYDSYKKPAEYVKVLSDKNSRFYAIGRIFISQESSGYQIRDVRDLDALLVKNHIYFMRNFITGWDTNDYLFNSGGSGLINEKSIDFLESIDVKYLIDSSENTNPIVNSLVKKRNYNIIYKDFDVVVYELNNKKYFLAENIFYVSNEEEMLEKMSEINFDPKNDLVIFGDDKDISNISNRNVSSSVISIIKDEGDKLVLKINNNPEDNYLFIPITYYPGWEVIINGNLGSFVRANYSFYAVKVPKGDDILIEFIYKPKSFKYGIFVSFFGLIVLVVIKIIIKGKKHKNLYC
ncbi:MAG: Bacterial membrane protein YfhO [candidate division CPR1 bacterium ADurb.Bin160]|uniref:Bacterial membrane protein YfhO n=1 Tax=candidate division CPR1 bacterium ADurb.Bin160 TaxID=1852826 RepID=A0A1V5ZJP8_9BACT|nr:MAG: Bacterial membrane protein YfhO [candidate division CPR1 bacterium ADurb.Bin160]